MGEIVTFVSGTFSKPNLGLPGYMKDLFKYWCVNSNRVYKWKPIVSTSTRSLTLPVHYSNKQTMKEAIRDTAGISQGSISKVYPLNIRQVELIQPLISVRN